MVTNVREAASTMPNEISVSSVSTPATTSAKEEPHFLRVMVDASDHNDGRPVHINIRVPFMLLRVGMRFAGFIPPQAQQQVNEALRKQGMNVDVSQIKPEDVNELLDQLRNISIDIDDERENLKVKIYAE
jgi:hypothetical protein